MNKITSCFSKCGLWPFSVSIPPEEFVKNTPCGALETASPWQSCELSNRINAQWPSGMLANSKRILLNFHVDYGSRALRSSKLENNEKLQKASLEDKFQ